MNKLDQQIIAAAVQQSKQHQLDMVATMFDHLAKEPKLEWLAMQYVAYCETVTDTYELVNPDGKAEDYLDRVMAELSISASESGATCDLSYDSDRALQDLLENSWNTYNFEIGCARDKTRKAFLSLLEHELSQDVS